ncbi:4Fe-4S binding protein [Candidatus Bipolaricaulota sp. J31]
MVATTCPVIATKERLEEFAQGDMCGRCVPCPTAVLTAISILGRFSRGEGTGTDLARLVSIGELLPKVARCPRGQEAGRWVTELVAEEAEELRAHLAHRCPAGECAALRKYRVIAERCTGCDRCREVCPRDAILGEPYVPWRGDNRPYEIVSELCDGCGRCAEACPEEAIELA